MMLRRRRDSIAHSIATSDCLARAWKSVRAAAGGPGVDRVTIDAFEARQLDELKRMEADLAAGRYRFSKLKCVMIPKPTGKLRRLGIPTVRDRVVLQAMRQLIEPACEAKMLNCSHAYRPGRGAMTAMAEVTSALAAGRSIVLETDIQDFFDSIRHPLVLKQISVMEPQCKHSRLLIAALKLSSSFWAAKKGVAQGSPLSPLLANVALTEFDQALQSKRWAMVRYADDLVVLCKTNDDVQQAMQLIATQLNRLGLSMHPKKTRIIDSQQNTFSFLGFEFHPDRLAPDASNIAKLRDGIAGICNPHSTVTWQIRIEQINSLLRSFAWYYHQTDSRRLFWTLDQYVVDSLTELETRIGPPQVAWSSKVVRMAQMREVSWLGSKKAAGPRKSSGWNGYGG